MKVINLDNYRRTHRSAGIPPEKLEGLRKALRLRRLYELIKAKDADKPSK